MIFFKLLQGNRIYKSFSAAASSMAALKQPTIRVVVIIAEGVPESNTKQLISYARSNNKVGA
jgi:ATP citrate (pro-S)-lyase